MFPCPLLISNIMKLLRNSNIVAIVLIVAGMSILFVGSVVRQNNASSQSQPTITTENSKQPSITDPDAIFGDPVELQIKDLGIQNQVIDGVFDAHSGQWTLTTDKVQYARMTLPPNDKQGLTFLYGHNRKEVFAQLPKIKPGSLVTLKTSNGHMFTYRFTSSQAVKPQDTSVFEYAGPPKLVLQTCTGLFYQNRQLFSFEFVGVSNA